MVAPSRHYTFDDYLSVEEMSAVRHEFLEGEIFAMAGGTPEHAALSAAMVVIFGTRLAGRPRRPYSADLRIRIIATGLATYADASVIRGEPVRDPASPTHVTNPSVVVELVAQDRREIEIHARNAAGGWQRQVRGPGHTVDLLSIGVQFTVDELYSAAGLR